MNGNRYETFDLPLINRTSFDIWTIPVAGGTAVQITDDAGSDWFPRWSPGSTMIAFNSDRSANED